MPQKPVFSKAPVLTVPHCFPANGTVRTPDARIARLYKRAGKYSEQPCLWEGLFRIACLTKNKPADEPVTALILGGIGETENGAFEGSAAEQICRARAAFAVYEYTADRAILKRIASWLRYLEVEFDRFSLEDGLLYRPADLMELLVRFYRVTGMRSVLRICAKLRASAFDWTTALHTFQQSIPIRGEDGVMPPLPDLSRKPEELDYDEKEKLINHGEMIADGVRYTLWDGLFSGHGQDLSSGKTVWASLEKHHRALCGGTTADPYLCGRGADRAVDNRALAAWTEAFAAQMILPDSAWAAEEMIRIVFNGMDDCLNREEIPDRQRINTLQDEEDAADPAAVYARITRATADAFSHAVTLTEEGIRINYLLPARYLLMMRKQAAVLITEEGTAAFQCKKPFSAPVDLFVSPAGTAKVLLKKDGRVSGGSAREAETVTGRWLHTEEEWNNGDGFLMEQDGSVVCEDTHHQGLCFLAGNRLLSLAAEPERFAFAVTGTASAEDKKVTVPVAETERWHLRGDRPADIPVLPDARKETVNAELTSYATTAHRITMFPKAENACLK